RQCRMSTILLCRVIAGPYQTCFFGTSQKELRAEGSPVLTDPSSLLSRFQKTKPPGASAKPRGAGRDDNVIEVRLPFMRTRPITNAAVPTAPAPSARA